MHTFDIFSSENNSPTAATNLSRVDRATIFKTGEMIVYNNEITEAIPMEFLIKTLPATKTSKPSRRNPPTIGIEFEIAYFAALIETPSIVALAIP